jgi:DNA invertase Pin-like site-specific DNA recombinase
MVTEAQQKVTADHLKRKAYLYVRQSTLRQVFENTESTKRQYALREKANALGWPSEDIVVIDNDLGQSGAQSADREGFQRLVADVSLGRAGVVMGLEVSRLARNSSDWHRLLEICALSNTLILDEDGIYNPAQFNDRLLLGLKGTMSEAELHVLKARLLGGQLNKAKRGALKFDVPVGFLYNEKDEVIIDPDQQVQNAIKLFFDTFRRTGSAFATCRAFHQQKLLFPRKLRKGPNRGEIVWGEIVHSRALQLLHNPRYAGVYCFGRTKTRKMPDGSHSYSRVSRSDWITFIPSAHPGYITVEEYEENQNRLEQSAQAHGKDRRKSPPREGPALLQGLVLCGICGNRMTVRYHSRGGKRVPDYVCQKDFIENCLSTVCQYVPGAAIDRCISDLLIESVTPLSLEVALSVQGEIQSRYKETDELRRQHVERIRYETELARKRYLRVDPDNRLVAASLESDWNMSLRALTEAQELYEKQSATDSKSLSLEQHEQILALAADFPKLWRQPNVEDRDRKRIVRLIIEDVCLKKHDAIELNVRFRGGSTRSLTLPLPKSAWELRQTPDQAIQELDRLLEDLTYADAAKTLNERGFKTGEGKYFNAPIISKLVHAYKLKSRYKRLREAGLLTSKEMAQLLKTHVVKVHELHRAGFLVGVAATSRKDTLFRLPSKKDLKAIKNIPPKPVGRPKKVES